MKITLTEAPWDSAGNLVGYVYPSEPRDKFDWKANVPFRARLRLTGTTRGHSAARFQWETDHGLRMEMFMADMVRLVQAYSADNPGAWQGDGVVEGEWIIVKRGSNYGVTPVLPDDKLPSAS